MKSNNPNSFHGISGIIPKYNLHIHLLFKQVWERFFVPSEMPWGTNINQLMIQCIRRRGSGEGRNKINLVFFTTLTSSYWQFLDFLGGKPLPFWVARAFLFPLLLNLLFLWLPSPLNLLLLLLSSSLGVSLLWGHSLRKWPNLLQLKHLPFHTSLNPSLNLCPWFLRPTLFLLLEWAGKKVGLFPFEGVSFHHPYFFLSASGQ